MNSSFLGQSSSRRLLSDDLLHVQGGMMQRMGKAMVLAIPLLLAVACGPSDKGNNLETKRIYSLCPMSDESRERLYEQVKNFADQHGARLIDRGDGARRELSNMKSDLLKKTGGDPILLTVEKPDEFRVSVTNLGLKEKMALTIRSSGARREPGQVVAFLDELGRFWALQRVEGGVTDDPPCD